MRRMHEISRQELLDYLEDQVTQAQAKEIKDHLSVCSSCQKEMENLKCLILGVQHLPPCLKETDLVPQVQQAVQTKATRNDLSFSSSWHRRSLGFAFSGAIVLMLVFLGIWWSGRPTYRSFETEGFQAKCIPMQQEWDRFCGLSVYFLDENDKPKRVQDSFSVNQSLLFAYTNLGPDPFGYLMIFAIDSTGTLFWFYPAFEREGQDPEAIPIQPRVSSMKLLEKIQHDFSPGDLTIVGLFTHVPWTVSQIEAKMADLFRETGWDPKQQRLPIEASGQHILSLEIKP